jgi:adenylate cyclase
MEQLRTENLTILFVDIAGFTATTSRQSRVQNAHLLQTFNGALLPLIKRSGGNVVKSIGDALLITFRSPTDAMLCTMALQDAMHEHNLAAAEPERIHIRVAANLGEVRVTRNDIFGEPVNVASRIESITPADEIYLSEAVYMAMNKAEVPAQEVGLRELAGVSHQVRVYSIPRFAQPRLVPERTIPADENGALRFPFGGMHHRLPAARSGFTMPTVSDGAKRNAIRYALAALALIALVAGARALYLRQARVAPADAVASTAMVEAPPAAAPASVAAPVESPAATTTTTTTTTPPSTDAPPAPDAVASSAATTTPSAAMPPAAVAPKPATPKPKAAPAPAPVWTVLSAKAAYRQHRLSRDEYKHVVDKLETDYDAKIRELKLAYRAHNISRDEYESGVRTAKLAYAGH